MQELQKVFCDTNIFLNPKFNIGDYEKVYVSIVTIEELDGLKKGEGLTAYQARKSLRDIKSADNVEVKMNGSYSGANKFLEHKNDNVILSMAYDVWTIDKDVVFLTDDLNLFIKAEALKLPCEMFEYKDSNEDVYSGIRKISMTEEEYVDLLQNPKNNLYNFYPNEYIIIHNTTSNDEYLFIWNGTYFEEAKIRPITNKYVSKVMPLDIYQKAFIHMLQNNTKVKITDSPIGCGKSFLMIHWALQMIEKGKYNKLIFVKSDSPPKGRKEFPAIPGGINEKCEPLMGVICDTTSENNLTDILLRNNELEIMPIQFTRGRSIKNTIMIINEAQNFTPSEMMLLLSRIGENSIALLDGSTQQIDNKNCFRRNGLTVAINNFKDQDIAAQVNLVQDFRSEVSRLVGGMDWSD